MSQKKVVSREYKMMLRARLFTGDEPQLLKTASKFSEDLTHLIRHVVLDMDGDLAEVHHRRIIMFYDTQQQILHSNYYIFRERDDIHSGAREVTLKFRHPDRYLAQHRNMKVRNHRIKKSKDHASHVNMKFEEDIKPPFLSFYSFSTTHQIPGAKTFHTMKDIAALYDDLQESINHDSANEEITIVGSPVREVVITGTRFQISKKPRRDAECALIIWYPQSDDERQPVVVEFSFRYGDKREKYTKTMTQRAYNVFHILQAKLTRWIDPKVGTKTAYMYQ
jgi:hypothetical protein